MNFNLKGLTVNNIVKNKYVLYVVALIALVDILGYIMRQEFSAVLFFYLVGMISYFLHKKYDSSFTYKFSSNNISSFTKKYDGF